MTDLQVPNFRDGRFGLLVTFSDHWYEQHCQKRPKRRIKLKIGIVTEVAFFEDAHKRAICWPYVRWEGSVMSTYVHPIHLEAFRPEEKLPMCTMSE